MASAQVANKTRSTALEDTAAFAHVAERFRRAGDLRRSVSLCRDGLRRFPDHVSARVTLGLSLVDLGEFEQAREELQQALRRAPDNLAAIRGLAHLHDHHGDVDGEGEMQAERDEPVVESEPVDQFEPDVQYEPVVQSESVVRFEPVVQPEPVVRFEPVVQSELIEAIERFEPVVTVKTVERFEPVVSVESVLPVIARDPELQQYFNALPYPPPTPVHFEETAPVVRAAPAVPVVPVAPVVPVVPLLSVGPVEDAELDALDFDAVEPFEVVDGDGIEQLPPPTSSLLDFSGLDEGLELE